MGLRFQLCPHKCQGEVRNSMNWNCNDSPLSEVVTGALEHIKDHFETHSRKTSAKGEGEKAGEIGLRNSGRIKFYFDAFRIDGIPGAERIYEFFLTQDYITPALIQDSLRLNSAVAKEMISELLQSNALIKKARHYTPTEPFIRFIKELYIKEKNQKK